MRHPDLSDWTLKEPAPLERERTRMSHHHRHLNHITNPTLRGDNTLHVIAVISNPVRFHSRYRLYRQFAEKMADAENVILHTVEVAFGDRHFEVTDPANPLHLQLRTDCEIWHKENMINLGVAQVLRTHPDAQYIAWIDADIEFARPDWAQEALHQLQHHAIVQLWSTAIDLGPNHETIGQAKSFASYHVAGMTPGPDISKYGYWHSGYAWAARRETLDTLGGLIDYAILGSADFYMAWALRGSLSGHLYNDVASLPHRQKGFTKGYIEKLFQWQMRAARLKGDIGCVDGTVLHGFHGRKKQRQYNSRENILINGDFDPNRDLVRDAQGLFRLVLEEPRQIRMRDDLRAYFRSRSEDSIDV